MAKSVYEQIGGEAAVDAAVNLFYRKMLADERVAHFFSTTDMDGQIAKQKAFLTMVMGGPNQYTGKDMREAHKHLKLDDSHVDIVIGHLGATLTELGVSPELVAGVAAVAEGARNDVLNR